MAKKKTTQEKPASKDLKASKLIFELNSLVKDMNESGLIALIDQAKKIKHSSQSNKSSNLKTTETSKKVPNIEIIPDESKNSFIIKIDSSRKFFTRPDFRSVVKICQGNEKDDIKASNLYKWLLKERKDFVIDLDIKKGTDPRILQLIVLIKGKYKVKQ